MKFKKDEQEDSWSSIVSHSVSEGNRNFKMSCVKDNIVKSLSADWHI